MTFSTEGVKLSYILLRSSWVKAKYFLDDATTSIFHFQKMDNSQIPPHVQMDINLVIPTPVWGQTSATVSFDTNTLIAAHQGAAWKISGWPDNIAIHHTKGCACCHKYINHLLGAHSLTQINLLHPDVENAVQSAWPMFINSIKIDADEHVQGKISDLHAEIDELKDALCDVKKSYHNAEVVLTKEHSHVKDLEQELLTSRDVHRWTRTPQCCHQQPWQQQGQHCRWSYPPGPSLNQKQDHPICPYLSQRPGFLTCPCLEMRQGHPPCPRRSASGATSLWKWMMSMTGSQRRQDLSQWTAHCLSLRDSNAKYWAPQSIYLVSIALKL